MIPSRYIRASLIGLFLALTSIFLVFENVNRDRILVLHSNGRTDAFVRGIDVGLHRAFGAKLTVSVRSHYMDAGIAHDLAGEVQIGETAERLVAQLKPTVLVTIGDDAYWHCHGALGLRRPRWPGSPSR